MSKEVNKELSIAITKTIAFTAFAAGLMIGMAIMLEVIG